MTICMWSYGFIIDTIILLGLFFIYIGTLNIGKFIKKNFCKVKTVWFYMSNPKKTVLIEVESKMVDTKCWW